MTTRARELATRIMPYCQWLHDGTEWHLRPEAEAEIEAALLAAEDEALERASTKETIAQAISDCRYDGIQDAEDYADRIIRALMDRPARSATPD